MVPKNDNYLLSHRWVLCVLRNFIRWYFYRLDRRGSIGMGSKTLKLLQNLLYDHLEIKTLVLRDYWLGYRQNRSKPWANWPIFKLCCRQVKACHENL